MKFKIFLRCCFLFISCFVVASCSSSSKKSRKSVFEEDSDFLKQDYKIEDFSPKKVEGLSTKPKKTTKKKSKHKFESKHKTKLKTKQKKYIKKELQDLSKLKDKEASSEKKEQNLPFRVGEKVVLAASFFGVEAGKITIGVDKFKKIGGEKVYNFYAVGKTSSVFSLFYKIQNKIESLWSPKTMKPISLAFDTKETKQKYKARVYFDWPNKKASFVEEGWSKKKGDYQKKKTWKLLKSGQDIVSAIFYTRTFPLEIGKTYTITVFENAKMIDAKLKVDRAEVLKTRMGRLNTLVLKPSFSTSGKFEKNGEISIWITDDEYRQVVRIETKIKIGTVVAKLHSWSRSK